MRAIAVLTAFAMAACSSGALVASEAGSDAGDTMAPPEQLEAGDAAMPPPTELDGATDAGHEADAPTVYGACDQSPFTQMLCYGSATSDAGTSKSSDCDVGLDGCNQAIDPLDANPPVWCCP